MFRKVRARLTYSNVMSTIAAFAAIGGGTLAIAAIPDRQGRINACYIKKGKKKGQVRLLASGTRCRKGEAKVSWNQKGQRGAQGQQGAQGQRGDQGQQGVPGTARAYAVIDPTGCTATAGSCGLTQATNVVGARRPQLGFYCVTVGPGIDRLTSGSMAGVEWSETPAPAGNAGAMPYPTDYIGASVCPGQEFTVATERDTTGGSPNLVNDVAFWFAVP
jgi:hypothetical protein